MSDKEDLRRMRIERLDNDYRILFDQLRHEDDRLSSAYNIFVLVQAFLFAGLVPLYTLDQGLYSSNAMLLLLKNILPLTGAMLCINGLCSIHRRVEMMNFWRDQIFLLEADSDFTSGRFGDGRGIYTARRTHQEKKRSKYPRITLVILKYQRYFIGILFLIGWILALAAQLYSYL